MLTRKSGMLALILGVAVLGAACEEKDELVLPPPPPPVITLNLAPDPVPNLTVGQTLQLVAIVSGTATQTATFTSSAAAIAEVNQTTGLVTAKAPGTAVITAVSTVDATARDAVSVTVVAAGPGGPPVGQPSISIGSVTQFGTLFPVNPGNVFGTIDVTMNVDIPPGVPAQAVRVTLNGKEVCRQQFAAGGSEDAAAAGAVPVTIVCSINTAATNPDGTPIFPNASLTGTASIRAQVVNAANEPLASATFQPIVLNNVDVIVANITTSKGPAAGADGLSWRGGDVTVTLTPTIFTGTANNPTSLTVTLTSSGAGVIQGDASGCSTIALPSTCGVDVETGTDADASNGFSVVFDDASTFGTAAATAGAGGIEDPNVAVAVNGLVASGNNFAGNTIINLNGVPLTAVPGGANVLRLDNLAPRVTLLDITPATLACAPQAACFVNGAFAFATRAGFAATVDLGVDRQTTTFAAGPNAASLTTATSGAQLAETVVANTNVLRATTTDALQNSRAVFATNVATCVSASSTSVAAANLQPQAGTCAGVASIQQFGVDLTAPTISATGNGVGVATAAAPGTQNTFTFSASDAGVGPSAIRQFNFKIEQITPAGTVCLNPAGAAISCTTNGGFTAVAAAGSPAVTTIVLPDASAYYRITATAQDFAGNVSTARTDIQLRDFVPPVAGGLSTPSSIVGNTTASFSAPIQDDVELGDILPAIGYEENAVNIYLANPRTEIGTYGFDVFSNTNPGVFTVNQFVRSIERTGACVPSTGAGCFPTTVISRANEVQMLTRDVAGDQLNDPCPGIAAADNAVTQNCRLRISDISAAIAFGIGGTGVETSFTAANRPFGTGVNNQGTFFGQTASSASSPSVDPAANTNVCSNNPVGPNAGCNLVTTTSITLFAQAKGPSQTFANPFQRVSFYAIDPVTGRSFEVCAASASAVDNTANNTRTWIYSCTWTPTAASPVPSAAGVYQVFALGVDASGRALASQNRQVTLTSD
ncbi:MAG: hypothetical protein ACT443_09695 [Gemmatimonadota bacterium]